MLPPFIIEQIRRREESNQKHYEQPQLELPLMPAQPVPPRRRDDSDGAQRGVVILEL